VIGDLREDSGNVSSDDALVSVLYSLLRDYIHPSDLEEVVSEMEAAVQRGDRITLYTNGWLARYAENLTARIRRCDG
jgi:hypothetical protein